MCTVHIIQILSNGRYLPAWNSGISGTWRGVSERDHDKMMQYNVLFKKAKRDTLLHRHQVISSPENDTSKADTTLMPGIGAVLLKPHLCNLVVGHVHEKRQVCDIENCQNHFL